VRRKLRWLVLAQFVGMLCLFGGLVLVMVTVQHNSEIDSGLCSGISGSLGSCGSHESYVLPVVLAGFGYLMAMIGFISARRLALKTFGRSGLRVMRRRRPAGMGVPGMPGGPMGLPGMPGGPPDFPGGLPPGTPGSPSRPPL